MRNNDNWRERSLKPMKKIIFISIAIFIILATGVWFFFFHTISPSANGTSATGTPFGVTPADISSSGTVPVATNAGGSSTTVGSVPTLFKVSGDPVAGAVVYTQNKTEMIRYVDRATGHIYDVNPLTLEKIEVVNTTMPKIYSSSWKSDGSEVIYRSPSSDGTSITNTSLTLTAPKSTSTGAEDTVTSTTLQGDISALATSATKIAYVLKDTGIVGISGFAGEKPQTVFSSAFGEWQIAWSGASNIELTTNASASSLGYSYTLNTSGSGFSKVLGPLTALTTLPNPQGGLVAYSYMDNGGHTFFAIQNTKTGTSSALAPATFPEKCVWSSIQKDILYCGAPTSAIDSNEPDGWYQGSTHFSDQIWEYNIDTGNTTLLADPKQSFKVDIDVINPELSPNEDYLIFMNKTDLSLWALKLSSE